MLFTFQCVLLFKTCPWEVSAIFMVNIFSKGDVTQVFRILPWTFQISDRVYRPFNISPEVLLHYYKKLNEDGF